MRQDRQVVQEEQVAQDQRVELEEQELKVVQVEPEL